MASSNEMFVLVDGKKQDATLHNPILDNKEAEKKLSLAAIARAAKRGMSRVEAEKLYGVKDG